MLSNNGDGLDKCRQKQQCPLPSWRSGCMTSSCDAAARAGAIQWATSPGAGSPASSRSRRKTTTSSRAHRALHAEHCRAIAASLGHTIVPAYRSDGAAQLPFTPLQRIRRAVASVALPLLLFGFGWHGRLEGLPWFHVVPI